MLLLTSLFAVIGTANADFNVITNSGDTPDPVAEATMSRSGANISGIPLASALKDMAPPGWHGFIAKGVDENFLVEVDRRSAGLDALRAIATRYNLHIKADPNEKKIYVSAGAGGMRDLDLEKRRIESGVIAAEQQSIARAETEGSTDFVVRSGQKLSDALTHFLRKGDWKVEWEAGSDFVVKQGYSVTGKSLRDVLDAALTPFGIHAVVYTVNRVVAVRSNATLTSPNANQ